MKVLDCTLRDGGYYTNWDFDREIVDTYIEAINNLPVDYLEVGYRNNHSSNYLGKYAYCPVFELEHLHNRTTKKIAVMLNEKDIRLKDLEFLLSPIKGLVSMIRLAVDPVNFDRAVKLSESVKKMDFEVGFNVMYMSRWHEYNDFMSKLKNINDIANLFCMVDSYGGVSPSEVKDILYKTKNIVNVPIGFHGHNNLEMALANTISAIDGGVDFIDATVLGMGRGAGNLKLELLFTYLNKHKQLNIDFNILGELISAFSELHKKYEWGTNLPYMISGANSLPQKEVMDWVNNRIYSFNSIVRALDNKKSHLEDNAKYPILDSTVSYDNIVIIGGGETAVSHFDGIKEFINHSSSIALIHATAKNSLCYTGLCCPQYYCLVGSEGKRLIRVLNRKKIKGVCVLPPYPRTMGTDVPELIHDITVELPSVDFSISYPDSCTTIALQTALVLKAKRVFVVGYDGYPGNVLSEKEVALTNENRILFSEFKEYFEGELISLTPTLYKNLIIKSVYQYV